MYLHHYTSLAPFENPLFISFLRLLDAGSHFLALNFLIKKTVMPQEFLET